MRAIVSLGLALAMASPLAAQMQRRQLMDGAVSYRQEGHSVSLAWHNQWNLVNRLWLGYGVRGTSYMSATRTFTLRDGTGPSTATLVSPRAMALNLMATADVQITPRIGVGANLDLVGVSTGDKRYDPALENRPQRWNVFQGGNDDRGSLHSEFYVSYGVDERVTVRAGVTHYVIGMELVGTGQTDAPRYNDFETSPFVSLRWSF